MDRDRRLTGTLRGQTDKAEAPLGFELNNPWKVCAALDIMIHELTREFSWKHAFLKQQYDGLERMVTKATQINKCNYTIWVRGINSEACRMGGSYEGEFNNFKQFISSYHEIC